MAAAEVGDEQEREDPTTNELQRRMAELLGHEAALFLPTATMANQAALRVLSRPGCKVVAEERTHVLIYEWGGPAIHSGLVMQGLVAEVGRPTPEQIEEVDEFGPGSVLVLENTHRSSGGRDLAARRVPRGGRRGALARRRRAPRRRAPLQRLGRGRHRAVGLGRARRHGHDLLLEGARLPVRRDPRRPGGDDRARLGGQVPLRRRAPAVGHRRGRDALRARPPRRAARRRPRPRAAARGGDRDRSRDRRDELRPHSRRARRCASGSSSGASASAAFARAGCAPSRTSTSATRRSSRRSSACRRCSPSMSEISERLAARLERLVRGAQREKRMPSIAAAVLRDGELIWETAVGAADVEAGRRGDAGHAVPHRLDHEDVHRGGDHAAPRRGQARPRGHARPARRGRGAHADDPPAALARLGPAARDAGRLVADAAVRAARRAARDARAGRARAPVRRPLPLLQPRLRAARHRRRARLGHAVPGLRPRAAVRAGRPDARQLRA